MKEFLSREGVAFTAYNVDEDDRAYDKLVKHGFRSVPVTFIAERALRGFDPVALREAVEAWRTR